MKARTEVYIRSWELKNGLVCISLKVRPSDPDTFRPLFTGPLGGAQGTSVAPGGPHGDPWEAPGGPREDPGGPGGPLEGPWDPRRAPPRIAGEPQGSVKKVSGLPART